MATHNEVAHNWAHQTGRAKNGPRMFYEGDRIYSHGRHHLIATFGTMPNGKACVLLNSEDRSVSTNRHQSIVRRAIPDSIPVFEVINPDCMRPGFEREEKLIHRANYADMVKQYEGLLVKAARARTAGAWHLKGAEEMRARFNEYTRTFRLGFRQVVQSADLEETLATLREKVRAAQAKADKKAKAKILKWIKGELRQAPDTRVPHLRVCGDVVESSWGIKVPLKRALALHRLAKCCKREGRCVVPEMPLYIGQWQIDRISKDGTIRAGCHVLSMSAQLAALKYAA